MLKCYNKVVTGVISLSGVYYVDNVKTGPVTFLDILELRIEPQGEPFEIPEGSRYSMRKDLSAFRNKTGQNMAVSEADCIKYIIQCRESHRIGDYTLLYGKNYYIYK